ncbi:MAG: hypothetical protein LAT55_13600 [Opitutales bacterium]|nr:hypothetical protein [Opitutales bacterium]
MTILTLKQKETTSRIEQLQSDIIRDVQSTYRSLLKSYKMGIEKVWLDKRLTPKEIIDELNEQEIAVEVFTLHSKLASFLEEIQPGITQTWSKHIGNFEIDKQNNKIILTEE